MKLNRFLGVFLIVGSLILNSCSVQTREVGFGGGSWSMPKSSNNGLAQKNTNVDSVVSNVNSEPTEKDINIVQMNSESGHLIIDKTFVKARKSNPNQKEINIFKHNKSNRLVSSKDLGKTMGWTSIILGALASLFSGAKVLSLLLAICGAFIGFVGLKIRPGLIGRILCYAGIALSIFSVFNGLIGSIITVLLLVALILILLILLKKA